MSAYDSYQLEPGPGCLFLQQLYLVVMLYLIATP